MHRTCQYLLLGLISLFTATLRAPAPEEKPDGKEIVSKTLTSIKLVRIASKGKTFTMGSPTTEKDRSDDEKEHEVKFTSDYYLGVTTITRGQFAAFVKDEGYQTEMERSDDGYGWDDDKKGWVKDKKYNWKNPGFAQTDAHPIINVSWNDAMAFCKWLSKKEGKIYRLPTEAEWEHACRAGTKTAYSFGDDPKELMKYGWFDGNADRKRQPVGQLLPNKWGLYDMHGNVYQWTADWHDPDYYKNSPEADPRGPADGTNKVMRGGEFSYPAWACRSAARKTRTPDYMTARTGFRVAFEQ